MHDKILILDFGSQVTQLIARRVREAHVYCEIHPNDVTDEFVREFAPKGVILSGSHASTYEDHQLRAPQAVWDLGVPVLGICYGMQTMAVQLGGKVEWSDRASSATPKCAPMATRTCSRASRTSPRTKATAC
jgi:GMP synthase (glutamine-hydrolysing)